MTKKLEKLEKLRAQSDALHFKFFGPAHAQLRDMSLAERDALPAGHDPLELARVAYDAACTRIQGGVPIDLILAGGGCYDNCD